MVESKGIDTLALVETYIRPVDAPGLIWSITPEGFQFHQKPRDHGHGGSVGVLLRRGLDGKLVQSLTYESFESVVVSAKSNTVCTIIPSVYRPPGACSTAFLDDFIDFVGFLTSLSKNFLIAPSEINH